MSLTRTVTRTHVLIGFANPFLICEQCKEKVPYWHDPDRCGCDVQPYNAPCEHTAEPVSICPSWNPVTGCECENKDTHDR